MTTIATRPDVMTYVSDASGFTGHAERVFVPANATEVAEVLREASTQNVPVTIAGAGYGLTGGRVPVGGWVISMEKFRRLDISQGFANVGAAISLLELREAAKPSGQFYAPDPTEINSSVGGTIGTNASGSRSFRYGSTRRYVNEVEAVFVDGRIARFCRGDKVDFEVPQLPIPNTTKYTAGYPLRPGMDWIDLICGSEGTLCVVTEAELKLLPIPEELFTAVIFFGDDESALDAVEAWRPVGDLRMLEYLDRNSIDLVRPRFPDIPQEASAALLIEAEGEANLDDWEARLQSAGALVDASWFALNATDRERFRKLRHTLAEVTLETQRKRGFRKLGTDYAVPLHRNRDMLRLYHQRLKGTDIGSYVVYGHIGDAHVHVNVLPDTPEQADRARDLLFSLASDVVAMGGTVSAEHGLGKQKAHLLSLQFTPEQIEAMVSVKRRLDPQWLLGRGNLLPVPVGL